MLMASLCFISNYSMDIYEAVAKDNSARVKELIAGDVNVINMQGYYGWTP